MLDGRVYVSDDNWATVWRRRRNGRANNYRVVTDREEADKVRYIVVCGGAG